MIKVTPVILCGGSGMRLWPLSRKGFPKQFLSFTGDKSLFQQSALRLASLSSSEIEVQPAIIVTSEDHRFLATEQLREVDVPMGANLLEPVGRNTAPALTLAALFHIQYSGDSVMVVTPADQTVLDVNEFTASIQAAIKLASQGGIVILGVPPNRPETGYGYIQVENCITPSSSSSGFHDVKRFVEKPHVDTAQQYLTEGGYFWNAGIFVLKASVWINALKQFRPDIHQATSLAWSKRRTDSINDTLFIRPGKSEFTNIAAESVDYAVMEHCPGSAFPIHMVPMDAGWNDLGAWDAVWGFLPKDGYGNAHVGDVITNDSRNTLVHASSRLVSLVGVENLIVVETSDAVLIIDKEQSQGVKHLVKLLQDKNREEYALHRKVQRPWGWYDSIDVGKRFKVKRINVKPGGSLSLQMHHHRAEHWIVVEGTAEITNGEKVLILTENQSTFIPKGVKHRLVNPGTISLQIIEVQSGSYLGEDDIVRYEDTYGRTQS